MIIEMAANHSINYCKKKAFVSSQRVRISYMYMPSTYILNLVMEILYAETEIILMQTLPSILAALLNLSQVG